MKPSTTIQILDAMIISECANKLLSDETDVRPWPVSFSNQISNEYLWLIDGICSHGPWAEKKTINNFIPRHRFYTLHLLFSGLGVLIYYRFSSLVWMELRRVSLICTSSLCSQVTFGSLSLFILAGFIRTIYLSRLARSTPSLNSCWALWMHMEKKKRLTSNPDYLPDSRPSRSKANLNLIRMRNAFEYNFSVLRLTATVAETIAT